MTLKDLQDKYNSYKAMNLKLNMQRGQPSDADFDLSNDLLTIVDAKDVITASKIDIRNYPGGVQGLPEARELFAEVLGVKPSETIVGNNASLQMMSDVLSCAMLRGLKDSKAHWLNDKPKIIVTVPGYDRHFLLLQELGFELVNVAITSKGPDMDAVENLVAENPSIKGILCANLQ